MCQRLQDLYCRSGGEQDTRGRAEEAVHDVPSPWDGRLCTSDAARETLWVYAVGRLDWLAQKPPGEGLLFAPKVHFLNTVLSRECPLRLSVRTRPIRILSAPCTG